MESENLALPYKTRHLDSEIVNSALVPAGILIKAFAFPENSLHIVYKTAMIKHGVYGKR